MEATQLIGAIRTARRTPHGGDRRAGFLTPAYAKGAERRGLRYVP